MILRIQRHREAGFTLLELIVAASILALIAVFSWRGLDSLIREREALATSQRTIDATQRLFARIERDALAAGDATLDGSGTLVLVAGTAALDGSPAAAVRYRYGDGALQRTVAGSDRDALTVLGDLSQLTLEAWVPTASGGSWVRAKQSPPQRPVGPATTTTQAQTPTPADYGAVFPNAPQAQAVAANATGQAGGSANANVNVVAPGPAASAIRLTFARLGGPPVTRTFLVGGG